MSGLIHRNHEPLGFDNAEVDLSAKSEIGARQGIPILNAQAESGRG